MEKTSEASAIIEVMERLGNGELVSVGETAGNTVSVLVLPSGQTAQSIKPYLDEYLDGPERKVGSSALTTLESFNEFALRHKQAESVVFVDDTNPLAPQIVAVFDAHSSQLAGWQKHRATYAFPLSDEWKRWRGLPESFSQSDFAAFLEDRITDVIDPSTAGTIAKKFADDVGAQLASPAKLLELARGLAISVDCKVVSRVNLGNGTGEVSFKEDHNDAAGAPVKVPGAFCIGIPVFRLGQSYSVPVRLRYRLKESKITWQLALQRIEHVFEHAIADAAEKVAKATGIPVFRGKPG